MIKLYTTHCPKCSILEKRLKEKNIEFTECEDITEMQKQNIEFLPMLLADGKLMNFKEAIEWVGKF